jgi:hypothetical protein
VAIVKNLLMEHEDRVAAITLIGIESKAVVLDESRDEIVSTNAPNADKQVYAKVFQAWADGKIDGTAEELFEAIQEVLEV